MAWQFLWGLQDLNYRPDDEIELDFRLADGFVGSGEFVFGVVNKEEMVTIRDRRWDLVGLIYSKLLNLLTWWFVDFHQDHRKCQLATFPVRHVR